MMPYQELKALESLLNAGSQDEVDRDYSEPKPAALTPGHIGPQYSKNVKGGEEDASLRSVHSEELTFTSTQANSSRYIPYPCKKEEEPVIDLEIEKGLYSGRIQPEYEFVYKQAVSANDVYMQMSEKNCSSMSCEDLVMKVKLPGTEGLNELELDVQKVYIKLISPTYFLALYLPHKVNVERSSAKWDAATCTLIVTMPIVGRDFLSQE